MKLQIDRKKIYVQIDFYLLKNNSDRLLIKKYNYSKFELIEKSIKKIKNHILDGKKFDHCSEKVRMLRRLDKLSFFLMNVNTALSNRLITLKLICQLEVF